MIFLVFNFQICPSFSNFQYPNLSRKLLFIYFLDFNYHFIIFHTFRVNIDFLQEILLMSFLIFYAVAKFSLIAEDKESHFYDSHKQVSQQQCQDFTSTYSSFSQPFFLLIKFIQIKGISNPYKKICHKQYHQKLLIFQIQIAFSIMKSYVYFNVPAQTYHLHLNSKLNRNSVDNSNRVFQITQSTNLNIQEEEISMLIREGKKKLILLYLDKQQDMYKKILNRIYKDIQQIQTYRKIVNKAEVKQQQLLTFQKYFKRECFGIVIDPFELVIEFILIQFQQQETHFKNSSHDHNGNQQKSIHQSDDASQQNHEAEIESNRSTKQQQTIFAIQALNIQSLQTLNKKMKIDCLAESKNYFTMICDKIIKFIKQKLEEEELLLPTKEEIAVTTNTSAHKVQIYEYNPLELEKQTLAVSKLILKNKEILNLKKIIKQMSQEMVRVKNENFILQNEIDLLKIKTETQNTNIQNLREYSDMEKISKKRKVQIFSPDEKQPSLREIKIYQNQCKRLQNFKERYELKLHQYQQSIFQLERANTALQDQLNFLKFADVYFQN